MSAKQFRLASLLVSNDKMLGYNNVYRLSLPIPSIHCPKSPGTPVNGLPSQAHLLQAYPAPLFHFIYSDKQMSLPQSSAIHFPLFFPCVCYSMFLHRWQHPPLAFPSFSGMYSKCLSTGARKSQPYVIFQTEGEPR